MKREQEQSIDTIFQVFLKESGIESQFYEHKLISGWNNIVSEVIAKATKNIYIKNKTLYVELRSSVIRNELMMKRSEFIKTLNNYAGSDVINQIAFC